MSVVVRNLSHKYSDGRAALHDVSFTLATGERVALLGPNGAGKTTLFLRLAGVLAGSPGIIQVGSLDPALQKDKHELPKTVGVVFQNPDEQLFAATVLDDVAFGPLNMGQSIEDAKHISEAILNRVGLFHYGDRVPHKLSGGEKRRVALAGVLVMNPELLLLDEPTAALDPRGRRELAELLNSLPGTMLIATHNLEFAQRTCSRGIILNGGRIHADGALSDLFQNDALLREHGLA